MENLKAVSEAGCRGTHVTCGCSQQGRSSEHNKQPTPPPGSERIATDCQDPAQDIAS